MEPHVYPDPQTAPLHLPAAPLAPPAHHHLRILEQLAAPDPTWVPKTMFICVAMSGPARVGLGSSYAPTIGSKAITDAAGEAHQPHIDHLRGARHAVSGFSVDASPIQISPSRGLVRRGYG